MIEIILKASLALLALALAAVCLVFAWTLAVDIDARQFESWIWTVIGALSIPVMLLVIAKTIRAILR